LTYLNTQQGATLGQIIYDMWNDTKAISVIMGLAHPNGADYINVKQV
jgi:hypothetical protein